MMKTPITITEDLQALEISSERELSLTLIEADFGENNLEMC